MMHKNKTFTSLTATLFGGLGLHRFYLKGKSDFWGWLHFSSLPLSLFSYLLFKQQFLFALMPLIISGLSACIESLVIGLTPDLQWDQQHNQDSTHQSNSGWPIILLLILTLGAGTVALIATIARMFDLLLTGGAYG